ncbi:hypothetical protein DINM_002611 [Dirofilaria immitis]|nr:hypothetical protein [Dirofilaria immitis]
MPKKAAVAHILEHSSIPSVRGIYTASYSSVMLSHSFYVRPRMITNSGERLSEKIDVDEYCKKYDEMAEEMLPKCSLMPGVMKLVRHLKAHSIPMAICTGATKKEFELKTRCHKELLDLISLRVLSGDDPAVKRGKPAPDPFLVTMERFKQKPEKAENVLVFEDATNGVYAAIAAGMHVVMVPDLTYMKIPEELQNKINLILRSLEDFKPESVGLPPYVADSTFEIAIDAVLNNEVPVGCVFVFEGQEVAFGRNEVNRTKNPIYHAEMVALEMMKRWCMNNRRDLEDIMRCTTLYVTLEPCIMCASALYHLRLKKILYGATNERFGGLLSIGTREKYGAEHFIEIMPNLNVNRTVKLLKEFYEKQNPFCPEEKRKIKKLKKSENENGDSDDVILNV